MALLFSDGFDPYNQSQYPAAWNTIQNAPGLGGPGRLGYGQYGIFTGATFVANGLGANYTTIIAGCASYVSAAQLPLIGNVYGPLIFLDSFGAIIGYVSVGPLGQIFYGTGGSLFQSPTGLVNPQTWFYLECQVTFSATNAGSVTLRLNGSTVLAQASVTTNSVNSNTCGGVGTGGMNGTTCFADDLYVLNTTAPNNTFLGDTKVLPLYPVGNGRVSGFSRFGGSVSGNYTAVNEVPPDGDTSYVYTSAPGTSDAYTITTLSNVTTIKATQIRAFARKDDTPSRVLALGVGNGTTENYDAGHSVNTTYSYIRRTMDQNPLTSATWSPADFATLQLAQQLLS